MCHKCILNIPACNLIYPTGDIAGACIAKVQEASIKRLVGT